MNVPSKAVIIMMDFYKLPKRADKMKKISRINL